MNFLGIDVGNGGTRAAVVEDGGRVVAAVGLLGLCNWARRTTSVLLAVTVGGAIPAVSSALVDFRILSLLPEALKVTICVVIWFYLMQPGVKEAFGSQRANLALEQ